MSDARPLMQEEIARLREITAEWTMLGSGWSDRLLATLDSRDREIAALKDAVDRLTRERDEARHKAFRECAEITAGAVPSNRDDPRYLSLRWVLERIRVACPEAFSDSPSAKDISAVIDEVCAFISPETCGADAGWFTPDKAEGSPGLRAAIDQAREHAKE